MSSVRLSSKGSSRNLGGGARTQQQPNNGDLDKNGERCFCCSMTSVYRIVALISLSMMIVGIVVPLVQYAQLQEAIEGAHNSLIQSNFIAYYYDMDRLVHNETVQRPSIKYDGDDFFGIPSSRFRAVWEGNIHIDGSEAQTIDIGFSFGSSANVTMSIDGVEEEVVRGYAEHSLDAGNHSLVVNFDNQNDSSTFLSSNFAQQRHLYSIAEARTEIQTILSKETKIVLVDIAEPLGRYNNLTVVLDQKGSYFLVLTNDASSHWNVQTSHEANLVGIAHGSSNDDVSSVNLESMKGGGLLVPIFYLSDLGSHPTPKNIVDLVGRNLDMNFTEISISTLKAVVGDERI